MLDKEIISHDLNIYNFIFPNNIYARQSMVYNYITVHCIFFCFYQLAYFLQSFKNKIPIKIRNQNV